MNALLAEAWKAWSRHSGWMAWNLFLAFIPLALSVWLFRGTSKSRSLLWWAGFVVFLAFLPNAPYLLTDIIHLIGAIRARYSVWVVTLVLIPQHVLAILAGFEAYVLCLINLGYYLRQQGFKRFIPWAELIFHALSAVGIYLGRFIRLNSWDLVVQPDDVLEIVINDLIAKRPVLIMVITFVILTIFYWLVKNITLGVILRMNKKRSSETTTG